MCNFYIIRRAILPLLKLLFLINKLIKKLEGAKNSPLFHYNPKPEKNKSFISQ